LDDTVFGDTAVRNNKDGRPGKHPYRVKTRRRLFLKTLAAIAEIADRMRAGI